eukprot:774642-Prymnesium_polylepis.1
MALRRICTDAVEESHAPWQLPTRSWTAEWVFSVALAVTFHIATYQGRNGIFAPTMAAHIAALSSS